jgi:hypothetical protein
MLRRIPVFQQDAVCLTKFGPESGETADEILARKDLERRSGTRAHKNEFWWGIGEKGAAQSINRLISQHGGRRVFRFSNPHYKNLSKDGKPGKSARWQRTTTALVRSMSSPISGAECDTLIDFSADLRPPYCVELSDPKQISFGVIATLNQQIANGLNVSQWMSTVSSIRM